MSDLLNKKYNIELEVLTPLHIGAGAEKDWMKGADYISDNGNVFVLNHREISRQLSANELSNYLLKKDDVGLKKKLSGKLRDVSDLVFNEPAKSENDIKTFIKNGLTNKPIVPGSSLKGSIRSILLAYLISDKNSIDRRDRNFEQKIFGSANDGDEFMRFIKIADARFEITELVNTKIFNLYGTAPDFNGGWKHEFRGSTNNRFNPNGFNTIYEIIPAKETGELSIALSEKAFDNFYKNNKPKKKSEILHSEPSQKLFAIINEHTKKYINKQIAFFKKYSNSETDKIIESLNTVLEAISNDNFSCVLQMSAGSGFHSITGDWQFDDFSINGISNKGRVSRGQLNHSDSSKSRKIATDGKTFDLMGFVKLSILTDEIIAERETKRKEKLEAEQKAEQEIIAKEKAEQERIEADRVARIEAERKAKEEQQRIVSEKIAKREALLKHAEQEEKRRQEANKEKRNKLKSEGLRGLNDISEFNNGKNLIREYKKIEIYIDDSQFNYIKEFIKRSIPKSKLSDWKSIKRGNWKDVKSWVGKETAQQWFDELIK